MRSAAARIVTWLKNCREHSLTAVLQETQCVLMNALQLNSSGWLRRLVLELSWLGLQGGSLRHDVNRTLLEDIRIDSEIANPEKRGVLRDFMLFLDKDYDAEKLKYIEHDYGRDTALAGFGFCLVCGRLWARACGRWSSLLIRGQDGRGLDIIPGGRHYVCSSLPALL